MRKFKCFKLRLIWIFAPKIKMIFLILPRKFKYFKNKIYLNFRAKNQNDFFQFCHENSNFSKMRFIWIFAPKINTIFFVILPRKFIYFKNINIYLNLRAKYQLKLFCNFWRENSSISKIGIQTGKTMRLFWGDFHPLWNPLHHSVYIM